MKFYSSYLPMIYGEVLSLSHSIAKETMSAKERLMRMHSRPKVKGVAWRQGAGEGAMWIARRRKAREGEGGGGEGVDVDGGEWSGVPTICVPAGEDRSGGRAGWARRI